MTSPSRSSLVVTASLASSLLIFVTMYANYRIIIFGGGSDGNRHVANDVAGHVGFLRMLERSMIDSSSSYSSGSSSSVGAANDHDDEGAIGGGGNRDELEALEEGVRDLLDRNDEMREYLIGVLKTNNVDAKDDENDVGVGRTRAAAPRGAACRPRSHHPPCPGLLAAAPQPQHQPRLIRQPRR